MACRMFTISHGRSHGRSHGPFATSDSAILHPSYDRMKTSVGLNDQHPALQLQRMLTSSPLPLTARRSIFQSLLKTALYDPLSWLQQPAVYRRNIFGVVYAACCRQARVSHCSFPSLKLVLGTRPARVQQSATSGVVRTPL